jgi:hypothetical protein
MANAPGPVLDDKTVIQIAYQDTLKKMFGVMMDSAAGAGGNDAAVAQAKEHFSVGVDLLRKVRMAAADVVGNGGSIV